MIRKLLRIRQKRVLYLLMGLLAVIFLIKYWVPQSETKCDTTNERGFSDMSLLLDKSNCKIPDISPRETCVLPLIRQVNFLEDCLHSYYRWTYTDAKSIVINSTAILESGYRLESIECCYKTISRKMQEEDRYDDQADNLVSYSSNCTLMDAVTEPKGEFFMVTCKEKSWKGLLGNLYQQYHWIPSVDNSNNTIRLENLWKGISNSGNEIPPSVILIGIDSTSRLNFHRQMPKAKAILEDLGAVEMLGYTKVGDNTFPNFAAMLSGYNVVELGKICQTNPWLTKQDACPYIWKRFSQANYFTSLLEDGPFFTGFNYKKTGFVKQPVDFYLRPLLLAAHECAPTIQNMLNFAKTDHIDCVGYKTNDETIVDSIKQVIELATTAKTPLYLHSWSTVLSHDDLNYVSLVDTLYSDLLHYLNTNGLLKNTVLFFLSDHGYRFGKIRETFSGWYEEKLPFLWIYLSPDIRDKFPDWHKSLQANSRKLTSTYHLYWTMNQILKNFSGLDAPEDEKDHSSGEIIYRRYQNTLLTPVHDDWSCDDVGVAETYCACYPRQPVDIEDKILITAAQFALSYVNSFLPMNLCAELKLGKILTGDIMDKTSDINNKRITYVVSLITNPGEFVLEAYIDYYSHTKSFGNSSTSTVQRTSKINSDVSCVNNARLELFCYCK